MKNGGTAVLMCVALVVAILVGVRSWASRRDRGAVPAAAPALQARPATAPPPDALSPLSTAPPWAAPSAWPAVVGPPAAWPALVSPPAPVGLPPPLPPPRPALPPAPLLPPPAAPPAPPPLPAQWPGAEQIADSLEAALQADVRPFQEAHWNGLEVVPATPPLLRSLGLPPDSRGVIVDDVTLPADLEGFQAGDLVTAINQVPTPDLPRFMAAADRVGDRRRAEVEVVRDGQGRALVITARERRLGTANGETAPMIRPGSRPPHDYLGPCTDCHRIGTTGQMARDPGDALATTAPTIRAGQAAPHRDRGECTTCHTIVP